MAFSVGGDSDDDKDLAEINIVPLVDVMLVLLIIFMVTAPLSIGGINVNLPRAKARGSKISHDRIVLSINARGKYFIEKMQIPETELQKRIFAIFEFRKEKDLYIRADKGVPYGRVVYAMSSAKLAGVTKLAMLTQPPGKK